MVKNKLGHLEASLPVDWLNINLQDLGYLLLITGGADLTEHEEGMYEKAAHYKTHTLTRAWNHVIITYAI